MPSTAYETGNPSKLLDQITSEFPHVHISTVNRRYFNEEKGTAQRLSHNKPCHVHSTIVFWTANVSFSHKTIC